MWVITLLDICRLMGNYPISYINIAYKAVDPCYGLLKAKIRNY